MNVERALFRLGHVKSAIRQIRSLLAGKSLTDIEADYIARAALERFLEVVSEASRNVPDAWKQAMAPEVDWRGTADLGNHLRHAYDAVDIKILWRICVDDLGPLERAVDAMIAAYGPIPSPPPSP